MVLRQSKYEEVEDHSCQVIKEVWLHRKVILEHLNRTFVLLGPILKIKNIQVINCIDTEVTKHGITSL